jgi:hypothetical protein
MMSFTAYKPIFHSTPFPQSGRFPHVDRNSLSFIEEKNQIYLFFLQQIKARRSRVDGLIQNVVAPIKSTKIKNVRLALASRQCGRHFQGKGMSAGHTHLPNENTGKSRRILPLFLSSHWKQAY